MGVIPVRPNQSYAVNSKVLGMLATIIIFMISSLVFIFCDAKHPLDYGTASFQIIAQIVAIVSCSNLIWKMSKILLLIQHCEKIIEKSKFVSLFDAFECN